MGEEEWWTQKRTRLLCTVIDKLILDGIDHTAEGRSLGTYSTGCGFARNTSRSGGSRLLVARIVGMRDLLGRAESRGRGLVAERGRRGSILIIASPGRTAGVGRLDRTVSHVFFSSSSPECVAGLTALEAMLISIWERVKKGRLSDLVDGIDLVY